MSTILGVEQQVLHAYVALENLGAGRSINDLADELGISRFTVSRMVKRARSDGLIDVRATIESPVDVELSGRLAERFGLRSAFAVHTPGPDEALARNVIARVTARYLEENAVDDDVLGLSPGRTLVAASRLVNRMPYVDVVQLTGVGTARTEDGAESVTNLGRVAGGGTYPLYAPIISEVPAHAITSHPAVQQTIRRFDHLTKAVMTIGGWPESSLLAELLQQLGMLDELMDRGIVGEIGGVLLDAEGREVPAPEGRMVGITSEQIRRTPLAVGVGGGPSKSQAVLATLRSGLCHVIITDADSARAALAA